MQHIKSFNINRSNVRYSDATSDYPGLLTSEGKNILDELKDSNISQTVNELQESVDDLYVLMETFNPSTSLDDDSASKLASKTFVENKISESVKLQTPPPIKLEFRNLYRNFK